MENDEYILAGDSINRLVLADGSASYAHGVTGLISENRGGTSKFYHPDALGSVRALTNTSGTVTDSRSTDAFGLVVASSGSTPTPFGFAGSYGYQQDSETGLMRLGHRMYDASTGRFISRDPIQDGYNWYVYCGNDSVNAVDPTGLIIPFIIAGIVLVGVAIGTSAGIGHAQHWNQDDWHAVIGAWDEWGTGYLTVIGTPTASIGGIAGATGWKPPWTGPIMGTPGIPGSPAQLSTLETIAGGKIMLAPAIPEVPASPAAGAGGIAVAVGGGIGLAGGIMKAIAYVAKKINGE